MTIRVNLDMDVLRTFLTGVELGSFSRAAERLGRSPSAISEQLKKLEEQAGLPLLRKDGRGLAPTVAGETMLSYARRILDLNDEAVFAMRGIDVEGWVRIGMPQDFAESLLPGVLGQFKRAHPKVRIEARVERNVDLISRVLSGELDLALAWGEPVGSLYAAKLGRLPVVWIGPAHPVSPIFDEREPLPLIAFEMPCVFRAAGVAALDAAKRPWRLAFTSPSLAGLWAATAAGLGVTLRTPLGLPLSVSILGADTGLPALPEIHLSLHRSEKDPAPAVARLAAIISETFTNAAE